MTTFSQTLVIRREEENVQSGGVILSLSGNGISQQEVTYHLPLHHHHITIIPSLT